MGCLFSINLIKSIIRIINRMSDVVPSLSTMPILKMEGGGVMPINHSSVIQQPMCINQTQPASIITSHPGQLQLLQAPDPPSPIHSVPSLVNDDIADNDNSSAKENISNTNQASRKTGSSARAKTFNLIHFLGFCYISTKLCYLWRQSYWETLWSCFL